jgi:outer membrane protein insertion porin family
VQDKGPIHRESRLDVAYIGPTLETEYRDNPFLPTAGFYTKWDSEYASPSLGSSEKVEFARAQGTASYYLRLGSPRWIWANSASGGYEKNLNGIAGSGVPESFAYFLGGYSTIRGYSGSTTDRIPNIKEFSLPTDQLTIPNTSTFQLYKSEVRFPIWGIIGGVAFIDAGEVDVSGVSFFMPFRKTYGFGIRVNTPVGPIVVDYGKKINKLNYETGEAWHFSIGTF